MHEHDARASCVSTPSMNARAYATDGRTDVLTQKYSLTSHILRSVSRAGGLNESHSISGKSGASRRDNGGPLGRRQLGEAS